jgi:hypothetical protein
MSTGWKSASREPSQVFAEDRPSVRKRDDRAFAPVFVVDCRAVFYRYRAHINVLLKFVSLCEQNPSQFHVLFGGHQYRSAFVLNQEHYEFRRFGLACVPSNDVDIIGAFVEGLTGCQSHFLSAPHLHHD